MVSNPGVFVCCFYKYLLNYKNKILSSTSILTQDDLKNIGTLIDDKFTGFEKKVNDKFTNFEKKVDDKFIDFAFIVNQGFSETQKQIEQTNKRIDKLYDNVDRFIHLHEKLDQELTMMRARVERLEEIVRKLQAA